MSKGYFVGLGVAAVVAVYVVFIYFWSMGVVKTEINLSTVLDGQTNVVETSMDTMVNTIVNKFKVNKQFAKDFIAVAEAQSVGRKGGLLFKSSTEAANKLGIPETIYLKMMNSIEGKLAEFKSSQDVLTSKWEEHKKFCLNPYHNSPAFALGMGPSLASKVQPKPKMISSKSVKGAMETKTYDGTNLIPDVK